VYEWAEGGKRVRVRVRVRVQRAEDARGERRERRAERESERTRVTEIVIMAREHGSRDVPTTSPL
jgi:hypothetical protein